MKISWLTQEIAAELLSDSLYSHLSDDGSLTRRVRERCPNSFEVQLLDHKTVSPNEQERTLLKLHASDQALARQVFLSCDGQARIFARTIIGLIGENRLLTDRIERLGEQSLGSLLFRAPSARKKQIHLAELPLQHEFFQDVNLATQVEPARVWVRRNLYDYLGCDLIVYEAFVNFSPSCPDLSSSGAE